MALAGLSGALRQRGQGDRLHGDSPSAEGVRGQGVRGQPLWGDGVYGDSPFEARRRVFGDSPLGDSARMALAGLSGALRQRGRGTDSTGTAPLRRLYGDRVYGDSPFFGLLKNWKVTYLLTVGDRLHGDSPLGDSARGRQCMGTTVYGDDSVWGQPLFF